LAEYVVGKAEDIGEGEHRIIDAGGRSVGVVRVDGQFFALRNRCAHQGGPVCEGAIFPALRAEIRKGRLFEFYDQSQKVICCPWHGWEYDVATGRCLADPSRRIAVYQTTVKEGDVVVEVP
jgi:3-phenylpropionate/trans-cinnamate dioxygenase ferredoxin subunit